MGFDWYDEDAHLIFSEIHVILPDAEDAEDYMFHIYRSFCYSICDYEENFSNSFLSVLEEKTKEELNAQFTQAPESNLEDSFGCPFDDEIVGYYCNEYDTEFVRKFVEICEKTEVLEEDNNQIQLNIIETIDHRLSNYPKCSFSKENNEYYIDSSKQLVIFVGTINELSIAPKDISLDEITNPVATTYHFIAKTNSGNVVADARLLEKFYDLCDYFNVDKSELCFYCIGEFIFIHGIINTLIPLQKKYNAEDIANKEYAKLIYKLFALREISPTVSINEFDFSHLTPNQFESMCYELLQKIGYSDVRRTGKTNAADGGKDIICYEEYGTLTGIEKRKWIWQCKHSKKSLDRKNVAEIGDLLEENTAKAYGLFCSNDLTPSAIDRLESKKSSTTIIYYGKIELTSLLSKYPDLISKYKMVGRVSND
jgi:hypothetical protein